MSLRAGQPIYAERPRSYASSVVLFALLCGGFLVDVSVGGGGAHLFAWLAAAVLIVGIDLITVRAARSFRSLTVTDTELTLGEHVVALDQIGSLDLDLDADEAAPILGRPVGFGLPKGTRGLALHLVDGTTLVVPSRFPDRLRVALQVQVDVPDIRSADADELLLLAEIDERADSLFRVSGIDLPQIPFPVDELHDAKAVLVVGRPPVGFVRVDEVDGLAHIEALAVIPGRMRRGLGSQLLAAACDWAAAAGYRAITLITFAEVPWNAPFYGTRGFVVVDRLTSELAELRDWEQSVGLDRLGARVVMRREL
ncbi:MAG: GNAT family N-acetyltransferase [Jatrophihabitantaceae bacterium]